MAEYEIPELREIPIVPKVKPGTMAHSSPFIAKENLQTALGYPGELVDNWEGKLLDKMDDFIKSSKDQNNSKYQGMIDQYFDLEQKIFDAKKTFITSLSDILSQEQIAKLLVFQRQFREEVRDILFKRGGPPEPPGH